MAQELIMDYAFELIASSIVGALGLWCRYLSSKLKKTKAEQDALKSGMVAILHDRLFSICGFYLTKGYIPVDEYEKVSDNTQIIYDAYHILGGNGTGTDIYNKFKKLHVENRKEE